MKMLNMSTYSQITNGHNYDIKIACQDSTQIDAMYEATEDVHLFKISLYFTLQITLYFIKNENDVLDTVNLETKPMNSEINYCDNYT